MVVILPSVGKTRVGRVSVNRPFRTEATAIDRCRPWPRSRHRWLCRRRDTPKVVEDTESATRPYRGRILAVAPGPRNPRIIAGEAGGRRLFVPAGDAIRPTSDRVKESIFAALGPGRLVGARVLDLYAGSGALGLEALSRGAADAVFVDRDPAAGRAIQANIDALRWSDRTLLRIRPVATLLAAGPDGPPFELAFLDPSYETPAAEVNSVLHLLVEQGWLTPDATVVVERAAGSSPLGWPAGWGSTWERCYGDTLVLFAQQK